MVRVVNVMEPLMLLGLALLGALLAHAVLGRLVKALLWAWSPLASGETEACTYQRSVYRTADPALLKVVCVVAFSGLCWGVGLVLQPPMSSWLMLAGVLGVLLAVILDLQNWERVAVSANNVWFQRGLGQTVHQVPIESISEVLVQEAVEKKGFTLWYGRRNRSIRLSLRMSDRRQVPLPRTDVRSSLNGVEGMANFLRLRVQQLREVAAARKARDAMHSTTVAAPQQSSMTPGADKIKGACVPPPLMVDALSEPQSEDDELHRALRRLRHTTLSSNAPQDQKQPSVAAGSSRQRSPWQQPRR